MERKMQSKISKALYSVYLILILLNSCNGFKAEKLKEGQNQLTVTANGDTLETGYWTYNSGVNGVSKSGMYSDGFKIDKWKYKLNQDSLIISWQIVNDKGLRFNVPDCLSPINDVELPVVFQADIQDNDSNTYLVLLKYDLKKLKSSAYDYLYQYNESLDNNSREHLKSKEFKKYYFEHIELFRVRVVTESLSRYQAISYIFVVKDVLYDLTYKNVAGESNAFDTEILNDILYSIECENADLFDYNSKKYLKEENIEFRKPDSGS